MKEGYKKTELGIIPKEWEIKSIGNSVLVNPESLKNSIGDDFTIDYIDIESVKVGKITATKQFQFKDAPSRARRIVRKDDVIISTVRPNLKSVAKIKIEKDNLICSTGFSVLRKKQNINSEYLYQFALSDIFTKQLVDKTVGSNYPAVNSNDIKETYIFIPTINEQQKIAEILSTVDAQIDDTDNLIEKTKELKKGLMQRLLTKGIGHSEFKKSEVGEIPVEWNVYELKEISERIIVGLATSVTNYYVDTGIPIIRNLNIRECKFDDSSMLFLDEKFANSQINKTVKKDDIITVHTGANLGLTCLVPDKYEGAHTFTTLITTVNKKLVDPMYIMFHINSEYGRKEIERLQVGGGKSNLNVKEFALYKIALPKKIEEQRQISGILSSVDKEIEGYKIKKLKLEELKKGLMQQLLTGKIRVV